MKMGLRKIAVWAAAAGAMAGCGGDGEPGGDEVRETPLPAQTPIGPGDVEPGGTREVVDPGQVPDTDRDGVPNAQDTALVP